MKHQLTIWMGVLLLLLLPACSDPDGRRDPDAGEVLVGFAARSAAGDGVQPGTSLGTSDHVQHVTYVQLYVFDGTEADAACIFSENVHWNRPTGPTASQLYKLGSALPDSGERLYTFLAVGLDCDLVDGLPFTDSGSGHTYGLPAAIVAQDEGTPTTLGEAVATVSEALVRSGEAQEAIASSELFAGYATAPFNRGDNLHLTIDLNRRVAGLLGYFTDIPADVARITLLLYEPQRAAVPLMKQPAGNDYADVLLTTPGAEVLLDLEVTRDLLLQTEVALPDGTIVSKQQGSVLQGAYLLPVPAPGEGGYTLVLQTHDAEGTVLSRRHVRLKADGTGTFPIEANHFYTIGRKDAGTDDPYSLGEAGDAVIYVDGNWQADVDIPM